MKHTHHIKNRLGANVRRLRNDAGLTQDDLSERAGIFRTYLSRIESGKSNPTLLVLVALADALVVTPCELLK
jgi:transcriptional regulator with XRE-family HTH domain